MNVAFEEHISETHTNLKYMCQRSKMCARHHISLSVSRTDKLQLRHGSRKNCWDGVSSTTAPLSLEHYCSTVARCEDKHVVRSRVRMRIPIAVASQHSFTNALESCNDPVQMQSNLVIPTPNSWSTNARTQTNPSATDSIPPT
jgi:hypothetical protein